MWGFQRREGCVPQQSLCLRVGAPTGNRALCLRSGRASSSVGPFWPVGAPVVGGWSWLPRHSPEEGTSSVPLVVLSAEREDCWFDILTSSFNKTNLIRLLLETDISRFM